MDINLIAIGTKMPPWVQQGFNEYQRRLNHDIVLKLKPITASKRTKNSDLKRIVENEGAALLAAATIGHRIVTLDVQGRQWDTANLARQLEQWRGDGRNVDLLVGGPEGLSRACLDRAEQSWSLSNLTLPHPLVRIVVAEALYRAWSVLHNHPYHRE